MKLRARRCPEWVTEARAGMVPSQTAGRASAESLSAARRDARGKRGALRRLFRDTVT